MSSFIFLWNNKEEKTNTPTISTTYNGIIKIYITKTCIYNFDPLKPHFYIVKLGFTGVYIIFLISAQKHRLWAEAVLTSTYNLCFEQKYEKHRSFFIWNFTVLEVKFSIYLNRCVLVMYKSKDVNSVSELFALFQYLRHVKYGKETNCHNVYEIYVKQCFILTAIWPPHIYLSTKSQQAESVMSKSIFSNTL